MSDEGCFPLVSIMNMNVVVAPMYVKLGEDLGIFDLVNEVRYKWEGVHIFDGMAVDVTIVLTGSKSVSFLLVNKEEG